MYLKQEQELVSLIIPIYNGERHVEKCMKCVMEQTYSNFEIIVINDGSTDLTDELCEKYKKNIRYFKTENKGVSSARNLGIKESKGKYIIFMDVDDYIYPDYIEYLYRILKKNNADVSVGKCRKVVEGKNIYLMEKRNRLHAEEKIYKSKEAILDLLYRRNISGYPYLKLVKRELALDNFFIKDIPYGEDFIFCYQILKKAKNIVYGNRSIYVYFQCPDSANHKKINVKKYIISWKAYEQYVRKNEDKKVNNAIDAKTLIYGLDFCTRLYGHEEAQNFLRYLKIKLKGCAFRVIKDNEAKMSNRMIAALCSINIDITIMLCIFFVKLKSIFKFELRQSL